MQTGKVIVNARLSKFNQPVRYSSKKERQGWGPIKNLGKVLGTIGPRGLLDQCSVHL